MASYCLATCSMAVSGMSLGVSCAAWVGFVTPKGGGGSAWGLAVVVTTGVVGGRAPGGAWAWAAIGVVVWAAVWVTVLVLWLIWLLLPWIWMPELAPGGLGVLDW